MRRRARQFEIIRTEQRTVPRRIGLPRRDAIERRDHGERRRDEIIVADDSRTGFDRRWYDERRTDERRDRSERRRYASSLLRDGLAIRDFGT